MARNPFRVVLQNPGFAATLARKPGLATAVVRQRARRVRRRRRGLTTPTGLEVAVTYACQARCEHCSATSLHDPARPRLGPEELRVLGAAAARLGIYEVNLTGGEPTLRPDLEEIVRCFAPGRTFVGVNTNGMLLDRARVEALRDAGVDLLKLSLDAPDAEAHDANRGLAGCFERVLAILEEIRSIPGIRGHVCSVGTGALVRSGDAARLLALAERHDATIGFTLPVAVGRWGGQYHVELADEDLAALRELCRHPRAFFQGSVGMAEFSCPAGRDDVYVTPYGDVLPCPFLQRSFGNVRERPLDEIYGRMREATGLAGDASLCLAGRARSWMQAPGRTSGVGGEVARCGEEHAGSFCRKPVRAGGLTPLGD